MPKKLFIIPGAAVILFAAVIFLNNRDYFSNVSFPGRNTAEKPDEPEAIVPLADSGNAADSGSLIKQEAVLADSAKLKDTVKTDSVRSDLSVFTVDSVKKKSESTKETHEIFAQKAAFSQEIKVFDCVIVSRPDIRLNIELEVICKNRKAETEILVRKNDIQTIVRSVLKNKELGDIKKGSLQEELVKAINGIFDMDLLTEVEFRSFHIEKVK